MRDHFQEVLELQLQHSSENTPAMMRRGELIRHAIPNELRGWKAAQAKAALPFKGRLNVQGKDGTGLKTLVPWVRIHSPELSPSPQNGWYVVYLFKADGSGVALCLSHGSTRFDGRDFKPRGLAEAKELMDWVRGLFGSEAGALGFEMGVSLGSSGRLSRAYESTTAFSRTYDAGSLPTDSELAADALKAVELLGQVYRAVELGKDPESDPPEIAQAAAQSEAFARPLWGENGKGQGFGLSHAERCLVEKQAMDLAANWLAQNGFTEVLDVHKSESCDFRAKRDGVEHWIEVKGTTAGPSRVLLTANEVELHEKSHPNNLLIVVHGIDLQEMRSKAVGGQVVVFDGWDVSACTLRPLSFVCELASNGGGSGKSI